MENNDYSESFKNSEFYYDYETLRTGGLVFVGLIVFLSIILLLSDKFKFCKSKKSSGAI